MRNRVPTPPSRMRAGMRKRCNHASYMPKKGGCMAPAVDLTTLFQVILSFEL